MTNQLYREQFMEIFKSNANFGQMDNPTLTSEQINPVCGDKITLELMVSDGVVTDAKFSGVACAVSKTASSVITQDIKGKKISDLKNLTERDMLELIHFDLTPSRQQCALLCFTALQKALEDYEKTKAKH